MCWSVLSGLSGLRGLYGRAQLWSRQPTAYHLHQLSIAGSQRNHLIARLGLRPYRAADGPPSPASDEDFLAHLHAREAAIEHSRRVIDLLQMAQSNLGGTGARLAQRQQCLMAEEYMRMGEVQMAQGLLLSAAATSLGSLCARNFAPRLCRQRR